MGSAKFTFTDQEFINVINIIRELDTPLGETRNPIISMTESLHMEGLDSLSIIVFFIWISQLFGIAETKIEEFVTQKDFTIQAIKDFVMTEATRGYTFAEAKEYSKRCF